MTTRFRPSRSVTDDVIVTSAAPVPNLLRLWRLVLPDYAEVDICRLLSCHGTSVYGMKCYVTKTAGV